MFLTTLNEGIRSVALVRPDAMAFVGNGVSVNYRELIADIENTCRFLMSQNLTAGNRAAIQMAPSYLHTVLILAMDRLGIASMSLVPGVNGSKLAADRNARMNWVFSQNARPDGAQIPWNELDPMASPSSLKIATEMKAVDIPDDRESSRVVRLIRSSGTTGEAKVVVITRELAMKRMFASYFSCEGGGTNRFLGGMHPATNGGYNWLTMALCRGATIVPWINAANIYDLINRYQISHMILSPLLLREIVDQGILRTEGLRSLRKTITGGAAFEPSLTLKARAVLGADVWNAYGSSESGSVARGHLSVMQEDPYLTGTVLPFTRVDVVDENDRVLPYGAEGIIRISSPLVATSYDSERSGALISREDFFYPGDIGSIDENRRLRISGRADERINHRGAKFMPMTLEQPIKSLSGVRDAAVFPIDLGDGALICAALVLEDGKKIDDLRNAIQGCLGPRTPERLVAVSALPKNTMGKLMRRELSKQVEDHLKIGK